MLNHPVSFSGMVTGLGDRRSVRLIADTNKGRISQVSWFNTVDGHPPTDISLTIRPGVIFENAPVGTVVGAVAAVDIDPGDTLKFDVNVTRGSKIPYCLAVVGGQLIVTNTQGLDFENDNGGLLVVEIGVTDSGGNHYSETFLIQLGNDRSEDSDADGMDEQTEEDFPATGIMGFSGQ